MRQGVKARPGRCSKRVFSYLFVWCTIAYYRRHHRTESQEVPQDIDGSAFLLRESRTVALESSFIFHIADLKVAAE